MTLAQAKAELKSQGMTISKTAFDEYRVNFCGGGETTAYYTSDIEDAVNTGRDMALRKSIRLGAFFEAVFSNGQTEARPLC